MSSIGKYCIAKNCKNTSNTPGVSFLRIPNDENRSKEWLRNANRHDLLDKPTNQLYNSYRLCSAHFRPTDYMGPSSKKLLPNAVPSIFPSISHIEKSSKEEEAAGVSSTVISESPSQRPPQSPEISSFPPSPLPGPSQVQLEIRQPGPSRPTPRTKRKIQRMQSSISKLRVKCLRSKRQISFQKLQKLNTPNSLQSCLNYAQQNLNSKTFKLFRAQLLIQQKNKFGRKWTEDMKQFALNLYFHSPRTYRLCAKFLELPAVRSLQRWLGSTPIEIGVNKNVMSMLQETIQSFSEREKLCILLMDGISLKTGLFYDQKRDKVIGFENLGHEISDKIANQALVFMIRWVTKDWKQPIAYYFSKDATRPDALYSLVKKIIQDLQEIGLTVVALVCDQGSNNQSVAGKLGITEEHPYFLIGNHKVFYFNDPPHLLKSFRNNFKKHGLKIGDDNVSWVHLENLFKNSHPLRLKLAPKITEKHISVPPFKNMKVSLAAQVFSESLAVAVETFVALGELPSEAIHTANFLERMDKLFDTFNSSKKFIKEKNKMRFALSDSSNHISFLKETLDWLQTLKFQSKKQPPSLKGWKVNIHSLLGLWEHLKEIYQLEYICTRKFNQDCLENLFSVVRQKHGCNDNPTPNSFENSMRHIFVSTIFKLSENSNCEEDTDHFFQQMHKLPSSNSPTSSESPSQPTDNLDDLNLEISAVE